MQPYINPNYFNAGYQNYYQQPQIQTIITRTVNSFDEISANDVPMSSPYSVFVKSDMSEIQLRRWNGNGQIESFSYSGRTLEDTKEPSLQEYLDERLDRIEKLMSVNKTTKKEVDEDVWY